MMAQKYLHELLEEDQEPFFLNKYISEKRSQIKTQISPRKKHKPLQHNSNFPTNLCKNVCLFSFPDTTTPDLRKSPLFEFQSPSATKTKSPIKFHIPSRTANLLLEAALKIQKHSSKTKTQNKSNGFGLLGSLFKRLTHRNQKRKEIEGSHVNLSVKDILKWESRKNSNGCMKEQENLDFCNGRRSAVWSESNEDKSLDMETSSSSSSRHCDDDSELQEIEFVTNQKHDIECVCFHDINGFCNSPFRFVLQRSPSSDRHTPDLPSPAQSPGRHIKEDKESNGGEEEEEDKEQCSPVCVLDPPFEDDDEGQGNEEEEENDDDDDDDDEESSDLRCSYAIMQRAKQQLLYKLHRFEKLAELDPVELEKRMLEDEGEAFMEEDDDHDDEDSEASYKENEFIELVFESMCHSSVHDKGQIPQELKKLVSDLIAEEYRELNSLENKEMVIRRVCKRLELWKEVECNTIDMMIEEDFSRENGEWKKNMVQVKEMAGELELAIFGFLVDEFSEELVC
ncbi:hypothetical protein TanjilG_30899 [Lupinus angustifolius]|uniref:DUF4378 domain-containing protein n=1 Tax=Lupinus angustifolius TaxID=3871 RepID=A0A1J7FW44_LUPAN|nr:PREDICTED: uncharacterized protein LOC109334890 [Lupinus angustifolius]OIV92191.1 hypothetical protein TanjilG_30899 [Lupinus angustifolius]